MTKGKFGDFEPPPRKSVVKPIFSVAIVGLLIGITVKILNDLDANKVVYNHAPGKCRHVDGIDNGSEDLVLLSSGQALISSGVYLPLGSSSSEPGKIYIYDPSNDASKAEPLTIVGDQDWKPEDFYPVGITVWEETATLIPDSCKDLNEKCPEWAGKGECQTNRNWMMTNCRRACQGCGGETTVYVINSYTHQIHSFQLNLKDKQLILKRSVAHSSIANPNNLIATGKDQFYLTNFAYYSRTIGVMVEFTQKLPFGTVWFFNGSEFEQVLGGLKGPNGIALSKSKKFLYVATHMEERIRIYRIEPSPPNIVLTYENGIDLYTGVDNLNVDQSGALWVASHPISYKSILHILDSLNHPGPSQVLKITFNEEHSSWRVEEVYSNDGTELSGSTTAALTHDGKKLLIGTLMNKVLVCQINQ